MLRSDYSCDSSDEERDDFMSSSSSSSNQETISEKDEDYRPKATIKKQ
jgi:hypothetical protein